MRRNFKEISNMISAAGDTGNVAELYQLESVVYTALGDGSITLVEAAELQQDIAVACDALHRHDYLDQGYAAIARGL